MKIEEIAQVCHDAIRAYCEVLGDRSMSPWKIAPDDQKKSTIQDVQFSIDNPNSPPSSLHDNWIEKKMGNGWKYGAIKDVIAKEHPCIVPYDDLPIEQKRKDFIFKSIVMALSN